ncbi:MAG TPA: hypothetical protein VK990_09155 [Acidimicrobiia bacterium]|nr:hypothetical protein [Acidimicrobiia bacterium]
MRRLVVFVLALVLLPAATASGAELDELLDESRDASYRAEQVITCSTPDGVRDAVIELSQAGGEMHVGAPAAPDVEVAAGSGGWALVREGSVVSSATVQGAADAPQPRYSVDDGVDTEYLGREATRYEMAGDGVVRAELIFDVEIGALLRLVTFNGDGTIYCERRFLTFDPEAAAPSGQDSVALTESAVGGVESDLPETLAGFDRLDVYQDDEGFVFAYYSDGFFSFAVFQIPSVLTIDTGFPVTLADRVYTRSFSPGQVTYAWETRTGAMAMVGDLPPDMHEEVLAGLPAPQDPGLLRRLWRSLFG